MLGGVDVNRASKLLVQCVSRRGCLNDSPTAGDFLNDGDRLTGPQTEFCEATVSAVIDCAIVDAANLSSAVEAQLGQARGRFSGHD